MMLCQIFSFAASLMLFLLHGDSAWGFLPARCSTSDVALHPGRRPPHEYFPAPTLMAAAPTKHNNDYRVYNGPALRVARCIPKLSRRQAEQAILSGRVKVDGNSVAPSYRLVGGQRLTLDNRNVDWESKAIALLEENQLQSTTRAIMEPTTKSPFLYYKYHKPVGVTCTMDKHDRRGLFHAIPPKLRKKARLFPVGRLDLESEGLVLLTNDGQLADMLLQPKFQHEKEYIVGVRPRLSPSQLQHLCNGIVITTVQQRGGQETTKVTQPCVIQELHSPEKRDGTRYQSLRIILCEGRNRQIRKMVEAVGSEVVSLLTAHAATSIGFCQSF